MPPHINNNGMTAQNGSFDPHILQRKANRFDALRLVFALCVFAFHGVALSNLWPHSQMEALFGHFAELAIQGFFIISGALVYGSLLRSENIREYTGKRVRRVYPAYAVIILIPALIALLSGEAPAHIGRYLAANLSFLNFLEPTLPGFYEGNRFPVVNGALWTLKIEVLFYMVLPLLMWTLTKCGRAKWIAAAFLYGAAEVWRTQLPHMDISLGAILARQLPGQMSFFISGIILWNFRDWVKLNITRVGMAGVVLFALSFMPSLGFLRAIALTGLIAFAAYNPGPRLAAARWGDISYGVYILHFPIVSALVAAGVFSDAPWLGFSASIILVVSLSFAMWWGVERHFLQRARRG